MSNLDTIIVQRPDEVEFIDNDSFLISHGEQGPRGVPGQSIKGDPGPPGPAAFVSADPDNRTKEGTDGGLYTPDLVVDPLAYYILAKS